MTRVITVYEKNGEKLLSEYSIEGVPLEQIQRIIKASENDPDLFQIYPLGQSELLAFSSYIPKLKEIDFANVELFYECFST